MPIANNSVTQAPNLKVEVQKNRALEIHEAYEKDPQQKGFLERGKDMISNGFQSMMNDFEKKDWGSLVVKSLFVVGGVWIGSSLLGGIFNKFKGVANWFGEKVKGVAEGTTEKVLMGVLKGVLGASAAGIIIQSVRGKIPLDEVFQAYQKDGVLGIGKLIAGKVTDLPKELAEKLGIPSSAKEAVEKGMEWMEEKLQFTQRKNEMLKKLEENRIKAPEWLTNLQSNEVAKTLGLNQLMEGTWKDYLGVGGFALLMWKFGQAKKLALTGAIYFLMVSNGSESLIGQVIGSASQMIDETKKSILDKIDDKSVLKQFIPEAFKNFSLKEQSNTFFNLMKDHPYLATGAITASWYLKGIVWMALKTAGAGAWESLKFGFKNPFLTTIVVGGVVIKRRAILEGLADIAFQDDLTAKEKFLREGKNILGLAEKETIGEAQLSDSVNSLLQQPKILIEKFKNGQLEFNFSDTGEVFIRIGGVLNAPWQIAQLSLVQFNVVKKILFEDLGEEGVFIPLVGAATTGFVLASMASETVKASKIVWDSKAGGAFEGIWKLLKAQVPGTAEWKFLMKSSLLGVPGVQFLHRQVLSLKIPRAEAQLKLLQEAVEKQQFKKAGEIADNILRLIEMKEIHDFKAKLPGNAQTYQFLNHLEDASKNIRDIETLTRDAQPDLVKIEHRLKKVSGILDESKTMISSILTRIELLSHGNIKDAMVFRAPEERVVAELEKSIPKVSEYTKQLTEGKTPADIQKRIIELRANPSLSPELQKELATLEGYLTAKLPNALENLPSDPAEKVKKLESAAQDLANAEKGINAKIQAEMDEIKRFATANNWKLDGPEVKDLLKNIDEKYVQPFANAKAENIKKLNTLYGEIPPALRTSSLKSAVNLAIYGDAESLFVKVKQGAIGRAKLMGIMAGVKVGIDVYNKDPKQELADLMKELGPDLIQLFLEVAPISGWYTSFDAAITGEETWTKKKVGSAGQRVANTLFGFANLAGDIASVMTLGAATPLVITQRLGTLSLKGPKIAAMTESLIKAMPQFEKIASRMKEGWKEFMETFVNITKNPQIFQRTATYAGVAGMSSIGIEYAYTKITGTDNLHPDLRETPTASNDPQFKTSKSA